jgi:hypothetical protein
MARKLSASFSNRVPTRRHSLSQPTQHSMMLRRRYASRSNVSGRPRWRASWSERCGITAPMARRRSHARIPSKLYPLSPATRLGRERGRPLGWGIRTASISVSNWVDSCAWPGVASMARGNPRPSVTMCSFVLNPPRERPRAWSGGSWAPPFSPLRPPHGWPGPSCRPRTTGPSRCGPGGPDGSGGPEASDPRFRRGAIG